MQGPPEDGRKQSYYYFCFGREMGRLKDIELSALCDWRFKVKEGREERKIPVCFVLVAYRVTDETRCNVKKSQVSFDAYWGWNGCSKGRRLETTYFFSVAGCGRFGADGT